MTEIGKFTTGPDLSVTGYDSISKNFTFVCKHLPFKRVLIIGASSLVGRYLCLTKHSSTQMFLASHTKFPVPCMFINVTDPKTVEFCLKQSMPDVIIYLACNGDVDYSEKNPESSFNVIVNGPLNVTKACYNLNIKPHIIYLSSNAVFDGDCPPYGPFSERIPVNQYGMFKADAENKVAGYPYQSTIIRPIMLFGWPFSCGRSNFVTRTEALLFDQKEVLAATDVITQPTYAKDLAEFVWTCAGYSHMGVFNYSSYHDMSMYDLACAVADAYAYDKSLIKGVPLSTFKSLAPRPLNTCFVKPNSLNKLPVDKSLKEMREEVR